MGFNEDVTILMTRMQCRKAMATTALRFANGNLTNAEEQVRLLSQQSISKDIGKCCVITCQDDCIDGQMRCVYHTANVNDNGHNVVTSVTRDGSSIIQQVIDATNCSADLASFYVDACDHNLEEAIKHVKRCIDAKEDKYIGKCVVKCCPNRQRIGFIQCHPHSIEEKINPHHFVADTGLVGANVHVPKPVQCSFCRGTGIFTMNAIPSKDFEKPKEEEDSGPIPDIQFS